MTDRYSELVRTLRERLAIISDQDLRQRDPAAHLEKLKSVSIRITALQAELPNPVDPQLKHFLDRCSYDKALAFLESGFLKKKRRLKAAAFKFRM